MNRLAQLCIVVLAGAFVVTGYAGPDTTRGPGGTTTAPSQAFPLMFESCQPVTVFTWPEKIMAVGDVAVDTIDAVGGADRITVCAGPHDGPLAEPYASAVAGARLIGSSEGGSATTGC